MTKLINTPED